MKKLLFAAALFVAGNASASVITFDNLASFNEAASGVTTVTFDGESYGSGGTFLNPGTTVGGVDFAPLPDANLIGISGAGLFNSFASSNFLETQNGNIAGFLITLPGSARSFAVDLGHLFGVENTYTITLGNGDEATALGASNQFSFFGLVSTSEFSTVRIVGGTLPIIDNVRYGNVADTDVPEPAALGLLGLGLLGLTWRRRRSA